MALLVFLSQIFCYSILTWVVLVVITFVAARYGKWPGLIAGQILAAFIVLYQDAAWMSAKLDGPGLPDDGPGFEFGCLARIVLINTVLLPIAWLAFRVRNKKESTVAA